MPRFAAIGLVLLCLVFACPIAATPAPAADEDPLKTANGLVKTGQYAAAQQIFERLTDDARGTPALLAPILLSRAEAYFAAGEFGRADAALRAAQQLTLPPALEARAKALAAKLPDKLSLNQFEGSATFSVVHDSRVRHRVTTITSANGIEIIEVCDDEPAGFDDEDGGPVIDTAQNCYYEQVTGDIQASSRTANIPDWQAQTVDKVEHRLALDQNGSVWKTVAELTETWQVEASDQDRRTVRIRSGPSWFIPDRQLRLDLGGMFLDGRLSHKNNLDYWAPWTTLEWRPQPDLRLSASYQYEDRHASPPSQIGFANNIDLQARWDVTRDDRITARWIVRDQNAQFSYNSYSSNEYRLTYRRGFAWFGLAGGFVEAEFRERFTNYNGPAPSDNGVFRRDTVPVGLLTIGEEFNQAWTVKAASSYTSADSTVSRYLRNDFQYFLSVTRKF